MDMMGPRGPIVYLGGQLRLRKEVAVCRRMPEDSWRV